MPAGRAGRKCGNPSFPHLHGSLITGRYDYATASHGRIDPCWGGNKKGRQKPAFFIGLWGWSGRVDSGNRAGIHTCAAIDASFGVDSPLLSRFAYGVGRAGIITCAAIDAFVGYYVSQDITSFKKFFYPITDYLYILCPSYHMHSEKSSTKKELFLHDRSSHQKEKLL
jgi:hypothetical protein